MSLRKVFDTESVRQCRLWLAHRPNEQFPCRTLSVSNTFLLPLQRVRGSVSREAQKLRQRWILRESGKRCKLSGNWTRKRSFSTPLSSAKTLSLLPEIKDSWLVESHLAENQTTVKARAPRDGLPLTLLGEIFDTHPQFVGHRNADVILPHKNWSCLGLGGLK